MSENQSINIGGVRFNKQDVQKSEVIKKDGKQMNSVFLRDGTHIVFPNQSSKNESVVDIYDKTRTEESPFGYNMSTGEFTVNYGPNLDPCVIDVGAKEVKTGDVEIDFYRINGAQITGTKKCDDYSLKGCRNTSVDLSQNDGKADKVAIEDDDENKHLKAFGKKHVRDTQHSVDGKVYVSGNNQVKQNDRDVTYTEKENRSFWENRYDKHKGKGIVKE